MYVFNCVCPQVEECHLPGLGVALTLDYKPDTADEAVSPLVSYVSGLLLGTNSKVRTWFSMFIRNGQQVSWQDKRQNEQHWSKSAQCELTRQGVVAH